MRKREKNDRNTEKIDINKRDKRGSGEVVCNVVKEKTQAEKIQSDNFEESTEKENSSKRGRGLETIRDIIVWPVVCFKRVYRDERSYGTTSEERREAEMKRGREKRETETGRDRDRERKAERETEKARSRDRKPEI